MGEYEFLNTSYYTTRETDFFFFKSVLQVPGQMEVVLEQWSTDIC